MQVPYHFCQPYQFCPSERGVAESKNLHFTCPGEEWVTTDAGCPILESYFDSRVGDYES
jgi:hypothetical protein